MRHKVLVTAASRHNGTQEIAEVIAGRLAERGVPAEARRLEEVNDLSRYNAVALGSGVYMNRWLTEARRFAQIHASELCMMPVWLFSSGPLGPLDHRIPASESADVPVLLRLTRALGHRTFGGRLDVKSLDFAERSVARAIHAPEGDSRDWDEIVAFANGIADELLAVHMAA